MDAEPDPDRVIEDLERELRRERRQRGVGGLSLRAFREGCLHLASEGLSRDEIAAVMEASAHEVDAALRRLPRRRALLLASAAAILVLAAVAYYVHSGRGPGDFAVDVVPEVFRAPGVLHVGSSFSLRLRGLSRPAFAVVVRIDPDLVVGIDFPLNEPQRQYGFHDGELLPGSTSGAWLEIATGSVPGSVTLVVALASRPFPQKVEVERALGEVSPAAGPPVGARDEGRERLANETAFKLRQLGAEQLRVVRLEVVE
jgi:hypothetical protein